MKTTDGPGQTACFSCPAAKELNSNGTACVACEWAKFAVAGSEIGCWQARKGHFVATTRAEENACPAGKYGAKYWKDRGERITGCLRVSVERSEIET